MRDVPRFLYVPFTVLAPRGVDHAVITSTFTNSFSKGQAGALMSLPIWIAPTWVSFYRVQISEVGEDANVSGYFANTNFFTTNPPYYWHHWPSGQRGNDYGWVPLSDFNQPPNPDLVGLSYDPRFSLPQPWSSGQISIDIPVDWKIGDNGPTNSMPGWNQVISINGNGTVTVTKYGKTVTRDTNNVVNPSL